MGLELLPQPVFHLSPPLKALSQGSSDAQILDLSNRFYTLIPHDFGMKKPPLLNNTDSVQVAQRSTRGPRVCWVLVLPLGLPLHTMVPKGRSQVLGGPLLCHHFEVGFLPTLVETDHGQNRWFFLPCSPSSVWEKEPWERESLW